MSKAIYAADWKETDTGVYRCVEGESSLHRDL